MFGVGFTSTVAVTGRPSSQLLALGKKVNVTVTGALVVLVNVTVGTLPVPEATIPVTSATLSLVHVNVVPPVVLDGTSELIASPEHLICVAGVTVAIGIGLTITVAVTVFPEQPLKIGVMVKVTVTGELVVLVKVPEISPVPEAPMPVTEVVLFLTQLYVAPGVLPVICIVVIGFEEQIVCAAGVAPAFGIGLTVTVAEPDIPLVHKEPDWNAALTRSNVKTPAVLVGTVSEDELLAATLMVGCTTEFLLKVMVTGNASGLVNVITGEAAF
jgi:hypothetical protein